MGIACFGLASIRTWRTLGDGQSFSGAPSRCSTCTSRLLGRRRRTTSASTTYSRRLKRENCDVIRTLCVYVRDHNNFINILQTSWEVCWAEKTHSLMIFMLFSTQSPTKDLRNITKMELEILTRAEWKNKTLCNRKFVVNYQRVLLKQHDHLRRGSEQLFGFRV